MSLSARGSLFSTEASLGGASSPNTFLDEIDQLQASCSQLHDTEVLQGLKSESEGISWLIPSVAQILPDLDPFDANGLSVSTIERVLQRSTFGLRLVGYPTAALQELFDRPTSSSPLDSEVDDLGDTLQKSVVEELPEWQNPDGEALLIAALRQDQGRPARDAEGLHVTPIFGQSGIEQGLALLQMVCETLRLPFRRDVVDRMLKGTVGTKPAPTLENLGQIADGLGLNALLMKLPTAHLGRLSCLRCLNSPSRKE